MSGRESCPSWDSSKKQESSSSKTKTFDLFPGFDTVEEYLKDANYFGATIGRYANRIRNGQFELDGVTYHLPINNGNNSLHGGSKGFDKVLWKFEESQNTHSASDKNCIRLSYESPDGDQGYPGNLKVAVIYELTNDNEIKVYFEAECDKCTPISLLNHSYFNLAGAGSGPIYGKF